MKTGVVPIGSNAGGIKEVIKHGEKRPLLRG
ncbi:hypothetical protein [Staphylococcus aureus]|nr:hypothetical protein [Staphylococcus aureus]